MARLSNSSSDDLINHTADKFAVVITRHVKRERYYSSEGESLAICHTLRLKTSNIEYEIMG